jgi:hypothetical protein
MNKQTVGQCQYPLEEDLKIVQTLQFPTRRDATRTPGRTKPTMPPADEDVDEEALLYGDVGACDTTNANENADE